MIAAEAWAKAKRDVQDAARIHFVPQSAIGITEGALLAAVEAYCG